jgi:cell wall-associated NlpC family hydrolase
MNNREDFLIEVTSKIGTPYIFGGNDPDKGIDCSGFAQWALSLYGLDPKGDQSAGGLYNIFSENSPVIQEADLGDLVFYGNSNIVSHVALALSPFTILEAGGGDHTTTSVVEAVKRDAKVRSKSINHRSDFIAVLAVKGYPWERDTTRSTSGRV